MSGQRPAVPDWLIPGATVPILDHYSGGARAITGQVKRISVRTATVLVGKRKSVHKFELRDLTYRYPGAFTGSMHLRPPGDPEWALLVATQRRKASASLLGAALSAWAENPSGRLLHAIHQATSPEHPESLREKLATEALHLAREGKAP